MIKWLSLLLFLSSRVVSASPTSSCIDTLLLAQLNSPPLLEKTSDATSPFELKNAGKLFSLETSQSLEDGVYIYVINKDLEAAVLSRIGKKIDLPSLSDAPNARFLGTHPAAQNFLASQGKSTSLLAAGELHILNGELKILSNRSGRFPGSIENLKFAESYFRAKVPRWQHYQLKDYSEQALRHAHESAIEHAKLELYYSEHPETKALYDQYKRFVKNLLKNYEDIERPMELSYNDLDAIYARLGTDNLNALSTLISASVLALNPNDSIAFSFHNLLIRSVRQKDPNVDPGTMTLPFIDLERYDTTHLNDALIDIKSNLKSVSKVLFQADPL